MSFLTYLFWPNPANASYSSPKALVLLIFCALLILGSIAIGQWRKRSRNPITKKLSRSWPSAAFWFGFVGLGLVVARVEQIGYVSMRLWWVVWIGAFAFYLWLQIRLWRARHYEVIPGARTEDPRTQYLPGKKRKR